MKDEDMHGCDPAGIRKISVYEALRKGASGTFARNSNIVTTYTNKNTVISAVLDATPLSCTTDGSGSAVETIVRTTWDAGKSYKVPGHPTLSSTKTYDIQAVC